MHRKMQACSKVVICTIQTCHQDLTHPLRSPPCLCEYVPMQLCSSPFHLPRSHIMLQVTHEYPKHDTDVVPKCDKIQNPAVTQAIPSADPRRVLLLAVPKIVSSSLPWRQILGRRDVVASEDLKRCPVTKSVRALDPLALSRRE